MGCSQQPRLRVGRRGKDIFFELGLQLLVTVVDTEPLKTDAGKGLEAQNTQKTYNTKGDHRAGFEVKFGGGGVVDVTDKDKPRENSAINYLLKETLAGILCNGRVRGSAM